MYVRAPLVFGVVQLRDCTLEIGRVSLLQDLAEEAPSHTSGSLVPPDWPSSGDIKFQDVCLRYREGLPLVLHNVCFNVQGGQKVGIVGRTGAGECRTPATYFIFTNLDGLTFRIVASAKVYCSTKALGHIHVHFIMVPFRD